MICQILTGLLWAALGSLRGGREALGDPLGVLGRPFEILGVPWWFLGCPFGVPGGPWGVLRTSRGALGEEQKRTEKQKVLSEFLRGSRGGWGPFG